MKNLYLICLLFIISACGTPTTEDRITFTQVDPFLKYSENQTSSQSITRQKKWLQASTPPSSLQ